MSYDSNLNPVLAQASNEDLDVLVDYLKEKLSESLTSSDEYKLHCPNHRMYSDTIADEIRSMGGNSFANLFRGFEGPEYHEIVCDVADKLKVPYNKNKSVEDIENLVLEKILETALESMSDDEKKQLLTEMGAKGNLSIGGMSTATFLAIFRAGGFYSYQLTLIIANQIARLILGRGLMFATNAALVRVASIVTGPIGWAVTGVWTAVDLAGPAYKVTIPCVIHIAMLRKKMNAVTCKGCEQMITDPSAKFCTFCGTQL